MPAPVLPMPKPEDHRVELSLRGLVLGVAITLVFTAANVYFGLKAGMTFATSIPAAVISMAILRRLPNSTIAENNIVQTVASAAGTLSSIIFVLPGLVMIGWWAGFPYLVTFAICATGGILGVMYSIPLRRALVSNSDLPYPEGVACAQVLKVGTHDKDAVGSGRDGLLAIVVGSLASAAYAIVVATQVFASDLAHYLRLGRGNAITGFDFSLSFALFAVGHLVGLWVGLAILIGALIAWGVAVPYLSSLVPTAASAAEAAMQVWSHKVRYIGAGAIGIAAVWTLVRLLRPVAAGMASALAAARVRKAGGAASLERVEQDIPIGIVGGVSALCLLLIAWLLGDFGVASGLGGVMPRLVIGGVAYVALMSFFVAAVCGYMAGLIGSSNSPLSGVGILVVVGASLLLVLAVKPVLPDSAGGGLVAFSLFITAIVFAVATISNDNLQDLKTGQLVGATPWRQQLALVLGVLAGAAVIPPILDLLHHAYGFAGTAGADPVRALAAPQAALISALAQGVIEESLDWNLIAAGVLLGMGVILVDELLRRMGPAHLPPLAVGLGIYLPTSTTLMIVVGAVAGWAFERKARHSANPQARQQLGVLLASGMIVGESLIGVALAAIVVFSGNAAPLALVGEDFADAGTWFGGIVFAASVLLLYGWLGRIGAARTSSQTGDL